MGCTVSDNQKDHMVHWLGFHLEDGCLGPSFLLDLKLLSDLGQIIYFLALTYLSLNKKVIFLSLGGINKISWNMLCGLEVALIAITYSGFMY